MGKSYFVLRYCIVVCLCKICVDISVNLSFFYPATHKFISNIKISNNSQYVNQLKHMNMKHKIMKPIDNRYMPTGEPELSLDLVMLS